MAWIPFRFLSVNPSIFFPAITAKVRHRFQRAAELDFRQWGTLDAVVKNTGSHFVGWFESNPPVACYACFQIAHIFTTTLAPHRCIVGNRTVTSTPELSLTTVT